MRLRSFGVCAPLLLALLLSGHVGSPNVVFEGNAGPYPIRVVVRPPGVVPGIAQITVRVPDGVRSVAVQPAHWRVGSGGAPSPDPAQPVPGESGLYSGELWLMDFGAYSVNVLVDGDRGPGTAIVPVPAVATRRLGMQRALGAVLLGVGAFLVVGLLTIVGAAVREGMLPPGMLPDGSRQRRARWAMAASLPIFALLLTGGKAWWDSVDRNYERNMYRPFEIETSITPSDSQRVLSIAITDSVWRARTWTPLVPDHGKLMHMFLIKEPGLDVFAHLHPARQNLDRFDVPLPPLPSGRYRLYADVVHESGLAQTFTDTTEIPPSSSRHETHTDEDDAWHAGPAGKGDTAQLADGSTMTWIQRDALIVDRDVTLRFQVRAPDGVPAVLQPYMGMPAHAVVTREDGNVFVHLHSLGTVSVAAQTLFARRDRGDTTSLAGERWSMRPSAHAGQHMQAHTSVVSFPYAFPQPGRYRIWVQVKREGRVLTGAFDAVVTE